MLTEQSHIRNTQSCKVCNLLILSFTRLIVPNAYDSYYSVLL